MFGGQGSLFDLLNGGGGDGGGGAFMGGDLLGQMFGGMEGRRRPRKGESTVQPLQVTLEDLYKGKTAKLQLTKKSLCKGCNGLGGKQGSVKKCEKCRGSGKVFITRQIGPGMLQQMTSHCDQCSGEGEIINEKDRCKTCSGQKTVQEHKLIEVKIQPGMRENQKIIFYGEGDQEPGIEPGDVILVIKTKPHEKFERRGNDLFTKMTVSLNEALCGYTTVIKQLDGRELVLTTTGDVIKPESIRVASSEGMPILNSNDHGNLYVIFDIKFPENHFLDTEEHYKKLEELLPPRPNQKVHSGEHVEEVSLSEFDNQRYRHSQGNSAKEAYHDEEDSDEEMAEGMGGAQRVQCAQQ